jgi:hypothetical protein
MLKSQEAATALVVLLGASAGPARANGDEPIQDNSFLIEEAYNQEPGVVFLLRPKLNLLLEVVYTRARSAREGGGTESEEALLVSPGLRFALDLPGGLQIVPGIAVPIGVGPSEGEWSVFAYLSFEHPF